MNGNSNILFIFASDVCYSPKPATKCWKLFSYLIFLSLQNGVHRSPLLLKHQIPKSVFPKSVSMEEHKNASLIIETSKEKKKKISKDNLFA